MVVAGGAYNAQLDAQMPPNDSSSSRRRRGWIREGGGGHVKCVHVQSDSKSCVVF